MPQDHRQLVIVDGLLPPRRDIHLVEANKNEQQQQPLKLRALAASGTEPPHRTAFLSRLSCHPQAARH